MKWDGELECDYVVGYTCIYGLECVNMLDMYVV